MSARLGLLRPALFTASLAAFIATGSVSAQDASNVRARIDELLTKTFPADAPGAVVLVVHRGEILLRSGYGFAHLELSVPMKPEHVFRLGSITKQFTAVGILQLVEAGKITLDDDITKYVPEVETGGHKITLTHLLAHTSGLPSFTDQPAWRAASREDMSLEKELGYIKDKPAHFAPGTDWAYSNTGYRLLGAVIEKVTGQTYADYVAEKIFQPAGMSHSAYDDTSKVAPLRVPGYSVGRGGTPINAPFVSMTQPHGAGALMSNVDDLWQWDQALAAGKLVGRELLAQAFTSARLSDGRAAGYGFGWMTGTIAGRASVEHGGGIQGFSTYALSVPDAGLYVAILCNSDRPKGPPGGIGNQIANIVLGKPAPVAPASVPAETLQGYAGVYRAAENKFALAVESERLVLKESSGRSTPLTAVSATEFLAPNDARYVFAPAGENPAKRVKVRPRVGPERHALRVNEPLQDPEKPVVAVSATVLDRYAAEYELMPNFVLSVKREGDALTAQATGQPMTNLVAESPTRFRIKQVPAAIEFKTDDAGTVTGLVLFQNGREIPGKRVK